MSLMRICLCHRILSLVVKRFLQVAGLLQPPRLLSSPNSASVLKIKTEISEPINFDNDSSIWNYPPNREISRNESPYSMTKPPNSEHFPSPQGSRGFIQEVSVPMCLEFTDSADTSTLESREEIDF
ncbi:Neuronal PAS domain-containing protein 3 [Myotis brandtii]|uniref:Neuronal PAS domain-containing protein 3 n=1 Tax=Myotis brandtii TaxID=109478 RepID=S7N7H3_MYOBR|nr:Neuronal PAS domain-containing protein 3 [Myotis brandtii]